MNKTELTGTWLTHISALLGVLGLLAVACFHNPDWLTSPTIREVYTEEFARAATLGGLVASALLAGVGILLGGAKSPAALGLVSTLLAWLWGGSSVEMSPIAPNSAALGIDWFILSLLGTAGLCVPLERGLIKTQQPVLRNEWRLDMVYFFMGHALIQVFLLASTETSAWLDSLLNANVIKSIVRSTPIPLQILLAVVVADFIQSVWHRWCHSNAFLWRIHSVHHSATTMDWLAGSRMHLLDILLTRTLVLIPLVLLGFSQMALSGYVVWVSVQAVIAHTNIVLPYGIWEHWLVGPRYHHWHHAKGSVVQNSNFAIHLPIIDKMMGTFHLPPGHPSHYGIDGPSPPSTWWGGQAWFLRALHSKRDTIGK